MKKILEDERLSKLNHSCAHLMAQAIKHLYPNAMFWVGPVIEEGFYYDVDLGDVTLTEEDLPKIEKEMKKIAKDGKRIVRHEISKEEALEMFGKDPYKVDLINRFPDGTVISCYSQGDFTDLCRGPHVDTVKELKYFKLLKFSGAYFKGDAKNKMLQRIYGVCFDTEEDLNEYMQLLEEAKERDHRKIGKDLGIFMFSDLVGKGLPMWLPNGFILRRTLADYIMDKELKLGYKHVMTPSLGNVDLYKTSGHWDHYKEDMFVLTDSDGKEQALKPMNCPNSIKIYQSKLRSYKDLPLRFNDVDVIHRNEKSGQLNGLFRVRMFRQDDSHNYVTEEQIGSEIKSILEIAKDLYSVFGLEYILTLSTRPDDFMGDIETWNKAEADLKAVLNEICGENNYRINEGDGAFYGPKIDIKMKDCLGREWQMGTAQLDFQLPQRFNLSYIDEDGNKKTPVMIHRALFGSFERFIGIITEHYAGAFPTWLAPVQVKVLPISTEKHGEYAKKLADELTEEGFRVEVDDRNEKIGYKIREAQTQKVPYMLVVGDKEIESNSVGVRARAEGDLGAMSKEEFKAKLSEEVNKILK